MNNIHVIFGGGQQILFTRAADIDVPIQTIIKYTALVPQHNTQRNGMMNVTNVIPFHYKL